MEGSIQQNWPALDNASPIEPHKSGGGLENREMPAVLLTHEQLRKIYDYVSLKVIGDASSLTGIFRKDRTGGRWGGYVYRALEHFAVLSEHPNRPLTAKGHVNEYTFAQKLLTKINESLVKTKTWEEGTINNNTQAAAANIEIALRQSIANIDELFDIIYPTADSKADRAHQTTDLN